MSTKSMAQHAMVTIASLLIWQAAGNLHDPLYESNKCYDTIVSECKAANISRVYDTAADQRTAQHTIRTLLPINSLKCAPYIDFLICTKVLRPCYTPDVPVQTCHEFCKKVENLCAPTLRLVGKPWPQALDCGQAPPASNFKPVCMQPPAELFEAANRKMQVQHELIKQKLKRMEPKQQAWSEVQARPTANIAPSATQPQAARCSEAELQLGFGTHAACMKKCNASLLFSREDKDFAQVWMLLWSVICLVCTALAVCTFAMDNGRFLFPERPIVWVACCMFLFSCGHLLRICFGPSLACSQSEAPSASPGDQYLITRHAGHWCAVSFLLLYFSSLAGSMWWAVLAVCFYLCAAKKWTHHAWQSREMCLHFFAWGLPLLLSVVLIVLHRIEGDELTHLCQVDGSDRANILLFVIIPNALILAVGAIFLVCAVSASLSVCRQLKQAGDGSFRRLEKLMTKVTMFSVLFWLPSACVLGINVYEYLHREQWQASLQQVLHTQGCTSPSGLLPLAECSLSSKPLPAVFMLKLFMSLAAGLPSGLIVWFNCKSATAWYRCCCRVILRRKSKPASAAMTPAYSVVNAAVYFDPFTTGSKLGSSQSKYPPAHCMSAV